MIWGWVGDTLPRFDIFAAALFLFAAMTAPAAAQSEAYMKHCVDDPSVDASEIVSSCTIFISDARQQNFQLEYVPVALYRRALAEHRLNKTSRAERDIAAAVKIAPSYVDAWRLHAEIALGLTGTDALMKGLDFMIAANQTDADVLNTACWERTKVGLQMDAAMADCNESLRLDPSSAEAFDTRCFAFYRLGQYVAAIKDCTAALDRNAKLPNSLYVRGLAKLKTGDTAGSNADIAAAKAINPKIADEYAGYGSGP